MAINYFDSAEVASRYAFARPDLNAHFNAQLLQHTGPLGRAADFGCGTGLSSRALAAVCGEVVGFDPAFAMLTHAEAHPQVRYCAGSAEAAPLRSRCFDLVAAALAFHWFDRDQFIAEVGRVLVPRGWLFIYNTWFTGRMRGEPRFERWNKDVYLGRYPIPPRSGTPITSPDAPAVGFDLIDHWTTEADVIMSPGRLATYLTTQSNVSAVVRRGEDSLDDATQWIRSSVEPLFSEAEAAFPFGGAAWLLRRSTA